MMIVYSNQQFSCHDDCGDLVLNAEVQQLGRDDGDVILRTLALRKPRCLHQITLLFDFMNDLFPSFLPEVSTWNPECSIMLLIIVLALSTSSPVSVNCIIRHLPALLTWAAGAIFSICKR